MSALGAVLHVVKGFGRAGDGPGLCSRARVVGAARFPLEFLQVPYGQSRYHAYRGELDLALRLDQDLLRLSRQTRTILPGSLWVTTPPVET